MAALVSTLLPALLLPRVPTFTSPRVSSVTLCDAPAGDAPLDAFNTWLASKGVDTTTVTGKKLPGFGMCLVAGENGCKAGDAMMAVPASLHITPSRVRAAKLGQAIAGVIPEDDDSAQLALGLLAELARGEGSALWPYLSILPGVDDMVGLPLLWTEEELDEHFAGSHLGATLGAVKAGLIMQWQAIEERVIPNHPELFPPAVFNVAGYLYAHAIVLTRALPFGDEQSLIPFMDLANHVNGAKNTCSIGVVSRDEEASEGAAKVNVVPVVDQNQLESLGMGEEVSAVLTAGVDLAPGEQAFIDYGEAGWRSSWEMLYTYGFVPGESPEDWMSTGGRPLFFDGIEPTDPLIEQKRAVLVTLGAGEEAAEGTWLDLRPTREQCEMMAPLLRLASLADDGTEPELTAELAAWKADPQAVWGRMQTPLSDETEAKVATKVIAACDEALAELPSAETLLPRAMPAAPDAEASAELSAQQERSRLAARVMLGERAALEACQTVWNEALSKVATPA